ncbi:MAG: ATP-binding cassette domain-containing protein [Pseudomonadota bacterium]
MASLEVRDLVYHRGGADGAFGVEVKQFRLDPGEAVGVVGPSGCGKSTLIDLFSMLLRPSSAQEFRVAGQDVMKLWREGGSSACTRLRASAIGVVLQTGGLLSSLTVWDNVLLSQRLLGRVDAAWALQLLSALDLSGLEKRLPSQLSVGQRQRVAIARSLAHRPGLVFADEPTASIGVEHAPAALALLMRLTQEAGAALLVVSHDLALLREHGIGLARCSMHGSTMRLENQA